jgi:hypothetical protein
VANGEGDDWATAIAGGSKEGCWLNLNEALAKHPPDAAASYHHEQNRQCGCACKRCNDCCERKEVHNAKLKCEKHAFPWTEKAPSRWTARASWQSGVRSYSALSALHRCRVERFLSGVVAVPGLVHLRQRFVRSSQTGPAPKRLI